jgi:hypothetical protein
MTTTKSIASSIWPVLVLALIVLGAGLGAMVALASDVTAGAITALVTAVLGAMRPGGRERSARRCARWDPPARAAN